MDKPFRCSDGTCVTHMVECSSTRCNANEPFMCPDGTCNQIMAKCRYPFNIRIVKSNSIVAPNKLKTYNLRDQNDQLTASLFTTSRINISYRGVALSKLQKSKLDVPNTYDPVYQSFLSKDSSELQPNDFLRSAAIEISMGDTRFATGKSPVKLNFRTNVINSNTHFDEYKRYVI